MSHDVNLIELLHLLPADLQGPESLEPRLDPEDLGVLELPVLLALGDPLEEAVAIVDVGVGPKVPDGLGVEADHGVAKVDQQAAN